MSISRFCRALGSLLRSMPKYHYAVRTGRSVGVYETWDECKAQVTGYSGARYKKFATPEEAWDFVGVEGEPKPPNPYESQPAGGSHYTKPTRPAAQSQSYAPASMSSGHTSTSEPIPVFVPEYRHPMLHTSERKREALTETDTYSSLHVKKMRSNQTGPVSSSSSSSTARSLSTSSPSSSSAASSGIGRAVVYTDGACQSNGRRGARAGVGVYWGDGNPYNTSERLEGRQTNQRAEITAAIRALQTAKSRDIKELTLYTDSKYTMNAINDWIHRWKVNGWKTTNRTDVLNKEDLQTLDNLCQEVSVEWKYVPGHANIKGNEEADSLARAGARMNSL